MSSLTRFATLTTALSKGRLVSAVWRTHPHVTKLGRHQKPDLRGSTAIVDLHLQQVRLFASPAPYEGDKERKIPERLRTPVPPPRKYGKPLDPVSRAESESLFKRWDWLLKLFGYYRGETARHRHSTILLNACAQQAARREFYENLRLEPKFMNMQAILMVHIWLVHRRLIQEGDQGRMMDEAVFDRLWEEVTVRIRAMGVPEISVNKNLMEVQKVSFGACLSFDRGLEQGIETLVESLKRNVFMASDDEMSSADAKLSARDRKMQLQNVHSLANYMHRELANLRSLTAEEVMIGDFVFGEPPLPAGKVLPLPDYHAPCVVWKGGWVEALDQRGRTYYWNAQTRALVWQLPEGCDTQTTLI